MNVEELNEICEDAYALSEKWITALSEVYLDVFMAQGKRSQRSFISATQPITAAGVEHTWTIPTLPDSGMTPEEQAKVDETRNDAAAEIAALFASFGLAAYGATFLRQISERGQTNFNQEVTRALRTVMQNGFEKGLSSNEVADDLLAKFGHVGPSTAEMLAQTELTAMVNERSLGAAQNVFQGSNEPAFKQWRTVGDGRVRIAHSRAEGQTVPLDQPFNIGGWSLNYPGDPTGPLNLVCRCRCRLEYTDTLTAAGYRVPESLGLVASGGFCAPLEPIYDLVTDAALAAAALDVSGLAMVALYPRSLEARSLSSETWEEIHTTLVFLGSVDDVDLDAVHAAVQVVAEQFETLSGNVGGVGVFASGPNGYPVIALPDVQNMSGLREAIVSELAEYGVVSPSEHGFCPHITLEYAEEPWTDLSLVGLPLTYETISVVVANERTDYRLGAASQQEDTLMSTMAPDTLTAGVTITITDDDAPAEAQAAAGAAWRALLAVEGMQTEDNRILDPGSISWRNLPLTMMAMTETGPGGHEGAEVAGRIDRIFRDGNDIWAEGVFDTGDYGQEIQRMVGEQTLRGNSVDLAVLRYEYRDPETGEVLSDEELMDRFWDGLPILFAVLEGVIMASTICPTPAIADAEIMLASGAPLRLTLSFAPAGTPEVVTASAAGMAPLHPPAAWFEDPRLDGPTALTVTKEGRVFGHAALFDTCHIAEPSGPGICVPPPRNGMNYEVFHHGACETAEGFDVPVGQITLGTTHAGRDLSWKSTILHYEHSGTAVADVRAGEDQWGIWVSGGLRPDVPAEKVREMKAGALSGDWRTVLGRGLEFLAALVVNVPGFPIPRPEARVVASAAGEETVLALVAAGIVPVAEEIDGISRREYLRQVRVLTL